MRTQEKYIGFARLLEAPWTYCKMIRLNLGANWCQLRAYRSKGCFHGASILDLQKGVCHAAANDHHVHLQPLRSSSIWRHQNVVPAGTASIAQRRDEKERSHYLQAQRTGCQNALCVIFFGAHAAEKKSTKQLSALSSMFMISWILSLTCTFGCLSGHVILICFPDLSKPKRFQGVFMFFCKGMVQTRGSKTQHCYVSALNITVQTTTLPLFIILV